MTPWSIHLNNKPNDGTSNFCVFLGKEAHEQSSEISFTPGL